MNMSSILVIVGAILIGWGVFFLIGGSFVELQSLLPAM